jgi:hypothetical protein
MVKIESQSESKEDSVVIDSRQALSFSFAGRNQTQADMLAHDARRSVLDIPSESRI